MCMHSEPSCNLAQDGMGMFFVLCFPGYIDRLISSYCLSHSHTQHTQPYVYQVSDPPSTLRNSSSETCFLPIYPMFVCTVYKNLSHYVYSSTNLIPSAYFPGMHVSGSVIGRRKRQRDPTHFWPHDYTFLKTAVFSVSWFGMC